MDRDVIKRLTAQFEALTAVVPLRPIRSAQDYDEAVSVLNQLMRAGGTNEHQALTGLVDTLGALIGEYDKLHHSADPTSPADTLRLLMRQHALPPAALPEIGTKDVVTEVLDRTRELDLQQIKAPSSHFHVPPSVFI